METVNINEIDEERVRCQQRDWKHPGSPLFQRCWSGLEAIQPEDAKGEYVFERSELLGVVGGAEACGIIAPNPLTVATERIE